LVDQLEYRFELERLWQKRLRVHPVCLQQGVAGRGHDHYW
jgi:hypothetical protein